MAAAATVRILDHGGPGGIPQVARDGMVGAAVIWDPEEMRKLALRGCRQCWGEGARWGRRIAGNPYPCNCVLRTIFRECLAAYRRGEVARGSLASVRLGLMERGGRRYYSWGLPREEYCADFVLLGRRELSGLGYRIFRMHFLAGWPWPECARKLRIDRGWFFHQVYLVEQRLGYALRTVRPYALHPVDKYFFGGE